MAANGDGMRQFISYRTPQRLYGLCWGTTANEFRLAASTFIDGEYMNKLQILLPNPSGTELVKAFEIDHPYPPTKVLWSPQSFGSSVQFLATTADYLRLYTVTPTSLERHATLSNKRNQETCAPLTSFDWNEVDPTMIATSSIDTTCTIWDLNNLSAPKQQIIAHDDEVYDIAFSNEVNVFGSVGGDGSLRLFDLRSLDSSTIVYESQDLKPLLRLAWNKHDGRYVAAIVAGSSKVVVIDIRNTSRAALELCAHSSAVNSISWSPASGHHLCSAAEDRTAIVYDVSRYGSAPYNGSTNGGLASPMWNCYKFFQSKTPINQISWSPTQPNFIALCDEEAAHVVQL